MASISINVLSALTDKLIGDEHYGMWQHQIKKLLMLNDIWSFVDGIIVRDPNDTKF